MQFLKSKMIRCSAALMGACLDILAQQPGKYTDGSAYALALGERQQELYLFRSGAKLARKAESLWYIYGYDGGRDVKAAVFELKAANHIRQAMSFFRSVDDQLHTPEKFRIKHKGLWGVYEDGVRTPSALNGLPFVRDLI